MKKLSKKQFKKLCLKNAEYNDNRYIIKNTCNICGEDLTEGTFSQYTTYWSSIIAPKCKSCDSSQDTYECQKIDADCNDCIYFKRGELEAKGIFSGWCTKFNKEVKAYPNFCSAHKCFVHRKDKKLDK